MDALNSNGPAVTRIRLPYWIRDFALVRPAVLTFAATACLSVGAITASYWQLDDARQEERRALETREAARRSFLYAESEKQEIRAYQPLFLELRRRHIVGAENRLDWVEAIRQIQEGRHLLPVTYEIEPQQPYKLEGRLATADYQLRGSRMTLHMDLLHEMDLFNFLDDLRQKGVFTVQQCALRRIPVTSAAPAGGRNATLSSDCTLNWLTLTPMPRRGGSSR
ncbi:hypothetical protein IP91_00527 [Pseudoduganella lurida]|uniref:PilN domain-containing protein n=1 Tax=Pseudoduganella lurida TaxID=1036180 RepID=A0A562RK89_9BURK|nr:hypothetical protein [Pseudoduganella lurida]TWI69459.1 hypothetical protein IP91_00527 [Pseudoduganella lurida]